MPRILVSLLVSAALFSFGGIPVHADGKFELSPFVGYRLGGEIDDLDFDESFDFEDGSSQGIAVDIGLGKGFFLELFHSHQETELEEDRGLFFNDRELFDVDLDFWHVGALYQWEVGQVVPFAVVSVGIAELDPAPSDLDSETSFSMGIGGGVKVMFNQHLGLRLEGRALSAFVDEGRNDSCRRRCYGYDDDSEVLTQFEAAVGLVFSF